MTTHYTDEGPWEVRLKSHRYERECVVVWAHTAHEAYQRALPRIPGAPAFSDVVVCRAEEVAENV